MGKDKDRKRRAVARWHEAAELHARAVSLMSEARAEVCAAWEEAEGLTPLETVVENHLGRFVYVGVAPGWMPMPDAPTKTPIVIGREMLSGGRIGERRHVYDWRVTGTICALRGRELADG